MWLVDSILAPSALSFLPTSLPCSPIRRLLQLQLLQVSVLCTTSLIFPTTPIRSGYVYHLPNIPYHSYQIRVCVPPPYYSLPLLSDQGMCIVYHLPNIPHHSYQIRACVLCTTSLIFPTTSIRSGYAYHLPNIPYHSYQIRADQDMCTTSLIFPTTPIRSGHVYHLPNIPYHFYQIRVCVPPP